MVISHRIRMYGIHANIWGILMVNVAIYGIHTDPSWVWLYKTNRYWGFLPAVCVNDKPPAVSCWLHAYFTWLVVWLPFFIFPYIGNFIIPIDFHIFHRGWNHQPVTMFFLSFFQAFLLDSNISICSFEVVPLAAPPCLTDTVNSKQLVFCTSLVQLVF